MIFFRIVLKELFHEILKDVAQYFVRMVSSKKIDKMYATEHLFFNIIMTVKKPRKKV